MLERIYMHLIIARLNVAAGEHDKALARLNEANRLLNKLNERYWDLRMLEAWHERL